MPGLFKSGQWYFQLDNAPVHNSILFTDDLTKMGIKIVPQPPYSPDVGPCDFWLLPKLRGCRYEKIEEMKEAVTKVIDKLTQDFLNKLLIEFPKIIDNKKWIKLNRLRYKESEYSLVTNLYSFFIFYRSF